jgi:O-antigen/teichoic acid export membrane protein
MKEKYQRIFGGNLLRGELIKTALGVGSLNVFSMLLMLVTSILLARALGPEGYGQYVFTMALLVIISIPFGSGLAEFITREVAKCVHSDRWPQFNGLLKRAQQWILLTSLLVVIGIVGSFWIIAPSIWSERWLLLIIAVPMLPLIGLNTLRSGVLRGLRYVLISQFPELIIRPAFHLILCGSLIIFGLLTPARAMISQFAAISVAYVFGIYFLRRRVPEGALRIQPVYLDREWARALLPFTALAAVGVINGQVGIILLGWLGNSEDVSALQIATNGAMLVGLSLAVVNTVIAPYISRAFQDDNKIVLQKLSRQSARVALMVSIPIALPLMFMGKPIIHHVFGEDYVDLAAWPLAIMTLGQLINVAFGSVGLFLVMADFERDTLAGQIIALLIGILAGLLLIPFLGVIGAALSVSLGLVTWNVVLAVMFARRLGIRPSVI